MKKILVIIGALKIGGAEKICFDFIKNMRRDDLDIHFMVFGQDIGIYESQAYDIGCNVIHVNLPKFPYIRYFRELKEVHEKYGPFDVVHSHMLLNNGINLLLFKIMGCSKLISHSHSSNSNRANNLITRVYEWLMRMILVNISTDLLACSKSAGNYLYGKSEFGKRGLIVKNGIDFKKFVFDFNLRKKMREQYGLGDKIVLGHVARLEPVKNHKFLLEVFSEVNKINKSTILVIIGDGSEKQNIQQIIREKQLDGKVIMLGACNNINELQNMMDIVVYPSLYEGLPVALVEAQINGLPCILSDTITREVQLASKVQFLSLEASKDEWVKAVLDYQYITREENVLLNSAYEYDIRKSSELLRSIYES